MSAEEVDAYLSLPRAATMATLGPDGLIHQVAMYFAWFDGAVHVLSKAKAQKVLNLRRDPRCSFHVESGTDYTELAGVNVAGRAQLIEDEASLWEIGKRVAVQRNGSYDESQRERVAHTVRNRVAVRLRPDRVISWDHAKLPEGSYPNG
jgi:PPOX class probable F420-dependent enzyme